MQKSLIFAGIMLLLCSCGNTKEEETEERVILFSCFEKTDSINGKTLENTEPLLYINYSGSVDGFTAKSVSTLEYKFRGEEEKDLIVPTILYLDNGKNHYKVEIPNLYSLPENAISILEKLRENYFTNFYSETQKRVEPTDSVITIPLRTIGAYSGKVDLVDGENLPFFLLDVSFDSHPALIVNKGKPVSYSINYNFDVYGLGNNNEANIVKSEPYNHFKSKVGDWTEGSGTVVDYNKKEIKIERMGEGSNAEFGSFITDIYKLDPSTNSFQKNTIVKEYDYGWE